MNSPPNTGRIKPRRPSAPTPALPLNQGLPCLRWRKGLAELSLLRSPEAEFCQVEQRHYEFWDHDGQRDTSQHEFRYAQWPHVTPVSIAELTTVGYRYNRAEPAVPFTVDGAVQVTAWKPSQDGRGWILRLYEPSGVTTPAHRLRPHCHRAAL